MTKYLVLLTLGFTLNFLNPYSSPANSSDKKHRTSQSTTQEVPVQPDRIHTGSVAGTVSDDKGKAVSGADVMLQDTVTRENPIATTTNDKGLYKFTTLFPGEYEVWAKKGDQQSERLPLKVSNGNIARGDLVLKKSGAHM